MPDVHLDADTLARLDALRADGESFDAVVTALLNDHETRRLPARFGVATDPDDGA